MDKAQKIEFQNKDFPVGVIAMESARELGAKINGHLTKWYNEDRRTPGT